MKFGTQNLKFAIPAIALLLSGCDKPTEPQLPEGLVAQATLSTNTLAVGDPVQLTLLARHSADSTLTFPAIGDGRKIVVRNRSASTRTLDNGEQLSTERYELTSFRPGTHPLLTNDVLCTQADGSVQTQALPRLTLDVHSVLDSNTPPLADIKGLLQTDRQIHPLLWILPLIALLASVAALLTRRRRTVEAAQAAQPPPPPHVTARQALDALHSKPWIPEPFFTELSQILRTYLDGRFCLNAPESTTEELTRAMANDRRLGLREQQTLRQFLTQADLVKFARAGAEGDVMRTAFATVETFVEQTKEEPQKDVEIEKNSPDK